jgi:chromosome segregation ATPase
MTSYLRSNVDCRDEGRDDENEDSRYDRSNAESGNRSLFPTTMAKAAASSTTMMSDARSSAERAIQEAKRQSEEMLQRQQDRKRQHEFQKALRSSRKTQEKTPNPSTTHRTDGGTSNPTRMTDLRHSTSFLDANQSGGSNNFLSSSPTAANTAMHFQFDKIDANQPLPTNTSPNIPQLKLDSSYAHRNPNPGNATRSHSSAFLEEISKIQSTSPNAQSFLTSSNFTTSPLATKTNHKNIASESKIGHTKYHRAHMLNSDQPANQDAAEFMTIDTAPSNVELKKKNEVELVTATYNWDASIKELRQKQNGEELFQLREKIAELEKSAKETKDSDIEAYQTKLSKLTHEKETLVRLSDELIVKHDLEITERDYQIEKLKEELQSKASYTMELEEKLSKITTIHEETRQENAGSFTENCKLQEDLKLCNEMINSLKTEVSFVKDENETLRKHAADTESQRDSLSRLLRDVEVKNKTAEGEIENMKSIISEKYSQITSLEENVVNLKSRLELQESQTSEQNNEISRLTLELLHKNEVIDSLKIKLDNANSLQNLLNETEGQRDSFARVVCDLETKNSSLISELDSTKRELAKSTEDLETFISDLAEKKSYISLINTKLKHLEDESNAKLEEHFQSQEKNLANIAEMNLKVKDLENQNIIGMQERAQLERKLKEAEEALSAAKSVAVGAQACLESTLQSRETTIASLEKSLASQRDTVLALREELVELKQKTEKQKEEIACKSKELSRMSRLAARDAQEIDKLHQELNTLVSENHGLSRQQNDLKITLESFSSKTSQIEQMRLELKKASDERLRLRNEVKSLHLEKSNLVEKMNVEERNRNSLLNELNWLRDERQKATNAMESDNLYISSVERELSKSKSNMSKLCRELDDKDHEIARLRRDSDDLRQRNSSLQSEIKRRDERAAAASKKAMVKLHQECQELEEERKASLKAMDLQLTNIRRENKELKLKLDNKDNIMRRNESHLQEIQAELHQCQALVVELQSKLTSEEMANSKLMYDVTQLTDQLQQLSKDCTIEKNELLQNLNAFVFKLEEEQKLAETLKADKKMLDDELNILKEELVRLVHENSAENKNSGNSIGNKSSLTIADELKRYLKNLKDEFMKVKAQNESFQKRLLEQGENSKNLEVDFKKMEESMQGSNASLLKSEILIETYKRNLSEQAQYIEWLKADRSSLEKDVHMLKTTLLRLESEIESYQSRLPEREQAIERLQAENFRLKEELQVMSQGLAQAESQLESYKSRLPNRDNFMEQLQSDNRRMKDELHKLDESLLKSGMHAEVLAGRISEQDKYIKWLQAEKTNLEDKVHNISKMLRRAEGEIETNRERRLAITNRYPMKTQDEWDARQASNTTPKATSQGKLSSFADSCVYGSTKSSGCSPNDFGFQLGNYNSGCTGNLPNMEWDANGDNKLEESSPSNSVALVSTELHPVSCKALVPFVHDENPAFSADRMHVVNTSPLSVYPMYSLLPIESCECRARSSLNNETGVIL